MCGIAGCVAPPGETPSGSALERMAAALAHRGPDDRGIEIAGSVGLVHTRLAIVDPGPAGHQPMADPAGHWLLTFNGEIFNHRELRRQLPEIGYRGQTDTETLLHALGEWGEEAVPRLNGQFAFAALDTHAKRLLLVRDHFGIKPLYTARHEDAFWFASEIRTLLAAGVPRRAQVDVLAEAALRRWPPGPATPIAGIERIQPGGIMSIDLETLEGDARRWYVPANAVDAEWASELAGRSREELTGLLEAALRTAVRRQLMADVPLGTMCSGGLDSSLVTAFAADERPEVVAYTASIADDPADEVHWSKRTAEHLGVGLEVAGMSASDWRTGLVPAVNHHEYPLRASAVPIARIGALARSRGAKVLLTGEGSDELFGGYPRLNRGLYTFLPARLRARRALDALLGLGPRRLPRSGLRVLARRLPGRGKGRKRRDQIIAAAGYSEPLEQELERRAARAYQHHPGPEGSLEASLLTGLEGFPLAWLLNRMDKNALQSSIEARVPFLDPDLVALTVNLPLEARIGPNPKGILRDVARRALPKRVAMRPKRAGLQPDTRRLIDAAARADFWEDGRLREELGVPRNAWRNLVRHLSSADAAHVYTAEIWCRLFLDAQDEVSVAAELWR